MHAVGPDHTSMFFMCSMTLFCTRMCGHTYYCCRESGQAGAAASDVSSMTEETANRLVSKAAAQIKDRVSAEAVESDGVTVPLLLHLLRSPNSGEACARWAPSDLLHKASAVAGAPLCCPYGTFNGELICSISPLQGISVSLISAVQASSLATIRGQNTR